MNIDNIRDIIKDLFTLRTVWIDKGQGRWAVKKRLHPVLKGMLCTFGVIICAVIYSGLHTPRSVEAEPKSLTITASLPKVETLTVSETFHEEQEEQVTPPVQEQQHIIIPLTTKASTTPRAQTETVAKTQTAQPASHTTIQLPSEMNPDTDMIITSKPKLEAPVNNGKYNVKINKSEYTLSLFKGNELVKTYSVAVGKNPGDKQKRGDNRTPTGNFKIVSIENASKWTHDFRDGKGKIAGAYGPWFLRLDAKGWKGIGIHGTHDPDSRCTNATEGCIRLSNDDIAELKQYAYKNMPVVISEN